jgi:hypothetical protein
VAETGSCAAGGLFNCSKQQRVIKRASSEKRWRLPPRNVRVVLD